MTPVLYTQNMTKMDLFKAAVSRIPEICRLWDVPVPEVEPRPHPRFMNLKHGSGGAHFGLYRDGKIWVNVADSSAPVRFKGRAWSYPNNKTDRTASGILFHELGHHVVANKSMSVDLWRQIVDHVKGEAVSGYEPTMEESFAETCRLFSSNPDLLRLACPKRYGYLLQYLTPWHQATWLEALAGAPEFIIQNAARWAGVGQHWMEYATK